MSEWRKLSKTETYEPPPLVFPCRWRYGPGNYCGVHVQRPETMCDQHKREDAERVAALRQERAAG